MGVASPCGEAAFLIDGMDMRFLGKSLLLSLALMALPVAAQEAPPRLFYGQIGVAEHRVHTEAVGVRLPWRSFGDGRWQLDADLSIANWSSYPDEGGGSRRNILVLEATPALRWQVGERWYLSGGIGATLASHTFRNHGRRFSTRFNFATHVGAGVWLDAARTHALELRLQHVSNASIKKPNPGEDFLQLRYLHSF